MKQKRNYITLNRYTIGILVALLVVATVFAALMLRRDHTDTSSSGLVQKTPGSPQFSFNAAGAPGWRQGPTDKVSLALFQSHECFTSIVHKTGTVNAVAALQKTQASLAGSGYTSTPGDVVLVTLQTTNADQQQYKLHQYTVSGAGGGGQVYGGQEFGYLQLSDSYLTIEGYCNTTDELSATIPALQAIKFDASK